MLALIFLNLFYKVSMANKTIEKITFKNFKAFREEQIIDFKNKNVLIYVQN